MDGGDFDVPQVGRVEVDNGDQGPTKDQVCDTDCVYIIDDQIERGRRNAPDESIVPSD